jgi:hypothetical protein
MDEERARCAAAALKVNTFFFLFFIHLFYFLFFYFFICFIILINLSINYCDVANQFPTISIPTYIDQAVGGAGGSG